MKPKNYLFAFLLLFAATLGNLKAQNTGELPIPIASATDLYAIDGTGHYIVTRNFSIDPTMFRRPYLTLMENAIFDGNGKTITLSSGAYTHNVSLFNECFGTIKNLNITVDGAIEANYGTKGAGGIAGLLNGGVIENCHVTINSSGYIYGLECRAGGIVGEMKGSTSAPSKVARLKNCSVTLHASNDVGGFIQAVAGTSLSPSVGGIAGYSDNCPIENCTATIYGEINGSHNNSISPYSGRIGGIVGYTNGSLSGCTVNIANNKALLYGELKYGSTGGGILSVGGLAGESKSNITNCTVNINGATLQAKHIGTSTSCTAVVGGLVGYYANTDLTKNIAITNSAVNFTGTNLLQASNSTNNESYTGGICGFVYGDSLKVTANVTIGTGTQITAQRFAGGAIGRNLGNVSNCQVTNNGTISVTSTTVEKAVGSVTGIDDLALISFYDGSVNASIYKTGTTKNYTTSGSGTPQTPFIGMVRPPFAIDFYFVSAPKQRYELNETFDTTGLAMGVKYTDGTTAILSHSDYTMSIPHGTVFNTQGYKTDSLKYVTTTPSGPKMFIKTMTILVDSGWVQISTEEELFAISGSKRFRLMNNLTISDTAKMATLAENSIFDGNGKTITLNKRITGLFSGYRSTAWGDIKNLNIIVAGKIESDGEIGALANEFVGNMGGVTFTIKSTGSVIGTSSVGGLIGSAYNGPCFYNDCHVVIENGAKIIGKPVEVHYRDNRVGGLIGSNIGVVVMNRCTAKIDGEIYAEHNREAYSGGLAGFQDNGMLSCSAHVGSTGKIWAKTVKTDPVDRTNWDEYLWAGARAGALAGAFVTVKVDEEWISYPFDSCSATVDGIITAIALNDAHCAAGAFTGEYKGANWDGDGVKEPIKNGTAIINNIITATGENSYVGGIAGWTYSNASNIDNCKVTINPNGGLVGTLNGGICGLLAAPVQKCTVINNGNITGAKNQAYAGAAGGIAGKIIQWYDELTDVVTTGSVEVCTYSGSGTKTADRTDTEAIGWDNVTGIAFKGLLVTLPQKTTYVKGEKFSREGMEVYFEFSDGSKLEATYHCSLSSSTSLNTAGSIPVIITAEYGDIPVSDTFYITVNERILDRIEVHKNPTKVTYNQGESFDITGLQIKAFFTNTADSAIIQSAYCLSIPVRQNAFPRYGIQPVTIYYSEGGITKTTTFNVSVNKVDPMLLIIQSKPTQTVYTEGERFDTRGLEVFALFGSQIALLEPAQYTLSHSDRSVLGNADTTVTVSFTNDATTLTGTFKIKINQEVIDIISPEPGIAGVIVAQNITENGLTLKWGKALDNVSAQETLKYFVYQSTKDNIKDLATIAANGTLLNTGGTINMSQLDVSSLLKYTKYYFNVVVEDEVGNKALYQSNLVTTSGHYLFALEITNLPTKTTYAKSEALDVTGLVVTAKYSDNTQAVIANYTTNPANGTILNTIGSNTINVSYTEEDTTKTASFTINVQAPVTLSSIEITTPPTKVTYSKGESLDLTGLVVTAKYSGNSTAIVTNYITSPANGSILNTVGNNAIAVSYMEENITKTANFTVEVKDGSGISSINVSNVTSVYPNPTSSKLIIENKNSTTKTAELFDLNGRLVGAFKISDRKTEIDISHLPNGNYIIKLGDIITKVVKQ